MTHTHRWIAMAVISAGLLLSACSRAAPEAASTEGGPATVVHLKPSNGSVDVTKVTLTEDAAKRLDIQTTTVREMALDGAQRKVIPYAAILYDVEGATWTYVNSEPLVYVRRPIKVDFIKGDNVILKEDLPAGTAVVTVGATELYGSESEFEEE